MTASPTLYIFAGLPGVGKTTLSRELSRELHAMHLRIDTIEHALSETLGRIDGPEGYLVAYQLAADNLRLGMSVVADSVNPLQVTRTAWRNVAIQAAVPYLEIEVICSDTAEHRARIESRAADAPGLGHPTWEEVQARKYDQWDSPPIVIDTAGETASQSLSAMRRALAR